MVRPLARSMLFVAIISGNGELVRGALNVFQSER